MKQFNLLLILGFLFFFGEISAQEDAEKKPAETLTISGEARARTEFYHGYKSPMLAEMMPGYTDPGSLATTQRTRFNLGYKSGNMKFGMSLQDVRVWGSQPQLVSNEEYSVSVHQAWGEINFTDEFSLKAGRMELAYDDQRILGSVGWAQQGRSHDLALFKYEGNIKAHLGIAFHGGPYLGDDAYKAMQFLWINGKAGDFGYSFLAVNNGKTEREIHYSMTTAVDEYNAYSQTIGTHLTYKTGALNLAMNAYYQMGKKAANWVNPDSLPANITPADYGLKAEAHDGQKIAAYNFSLEAMYKVNDNFKAGFAFETLSGNDLTDADRTDENAFAPLYGTNHKFNGWMDYFYVGNHSSNVGLNDISAKFIYKDGPFFVKLIPHYFMPANSAEYTDTEGNTQDLGALGTEIDIWAGYNFIPKVASIQFGYSHMLATESMYALKGMLVPEDDRGTNNWAWIMFTVKPKWNFTK